MLKNGFNLFNSFIITTFALVKTKENLDYEDKERTSRIE